MSNLKTQISAQNPAQNSVQNYAQNHTQNSAQNHTQIPAQNSATNDQGAKYPAIKGTNAELFVSTLWQRVESGGFLAFSKNDICDYLLYLFNKYGDHFLDENPNELNERLLKTTAAKIKATKKNIAVKFMDDKEYGGIFVQFLANFAQNIAEKRVIVKGDRLHFVLENRALRDIIEAKLKKLTQDTLDYSFNSEKVSISAENFFALLKCEVAKPYKAEFDALIKKYKWQKFFTKGGKILYDIAKLTGLASNLAVITDFVINHAKEG